MCLGIQPTHILLARGKRVSCYHQRILHLLIQTLAGSRPCGLARLHASSPCLGNQGQCMYWSTPLSFLPFPSALGLCWEVLRGSQVLSAKDWNGEHQGWRPRVGPGWPHLNWAEERSQILASLRSWKMIFTPYICKYELIYKPA